ncbi:uncharacterized protein G2W53_002519 [Senna tora]|uniref:Uncharacterized protein n=1 Tax=Senna tora TaxID=362788 RepID=A0A834XK13_9FABA|nr:uncharacterized protein G2W53_002519 [Senna tora]
MDFTMNLFVRPWASNMRKRGGNPQIWNWRVGGWAIWCEPFVVHVAVFSRGRQRESPAPEASLCQVTHGPNGAFEVVRCAERRECECKWWWGGEIEVQEEAVLACGGDDVDEFIVAWGGGIPGGVADGGIVALFPEKRHHEVPVAVGNVGNTNTTLVHLTTSSITILLSSSSECWLPLLATSLALASSSRGSVIREGGI